MIGDNLVENPSHRAEIWGWKTCPMAIFRRKFSEHFQLLLVKFFTIFEENQGFGPVFRTIWRVIVMHIYNHIENILGSFLKQSDRRVTPRLLGII
jgi:hypothetical protein